MCAGIVEEKETEKFIREIWLPGKTSPEAFWLATKAAGSSNRHYVSDTYYEALIEEAKKNLGLSSRPQVIGYSRTVLAVDTVKALTYIDDDQTAELLNRVLVVQYGWLRELCIQALGSSRNPHAHSVLRSTIVNLRPFSDVFLAAPYFNRREWLSILASSVFSFEGPEYILSVLTGKTRWLNGWLVALFWVVVICLPFLLLDLLVKNHFFNLDFTVLSGRLLALFVFLILLRYHFGTVSRLLCSKKSAMEKLKSRRKEFTWADPLLLIPIVVLLLFPTETLLLLEFIALYAWLIVFIVAIILRIKHPPRIAYLLYIQGLIALILACIVFLWGKILPYAQKVAEINEAHIAILASVTVVLHRVLSLLVNQSLYQTDQVLTLLVFALCAMVCLTTFYAFWRLREYRIAYLRGDKLEAVRQRIKDIALNPSGWEQVRERAFKVLRNVELPPQDIEDLENLIKNEKDQDFQRELEHTVYELQTRAREKDREGKLLNKKTARNLANQGGDHRRMKRYHEAIAAFNRAISIDEKNVEFITERGITYRQMKQYQEALDDFTRAILLDDKYIPAIGQRYITYQQMKRYQEALDDLAHIIALEKKNAQAIFYRGVIYRQMGRYQDALSHFDRALALDEKNDWIIANRGMIYLLTGRYREALTDFNLAIALDEKSHWYRYCRALLYMVTGKTSEFKSELNNAIDLAQVRLDKATEDWQTSLSFDLALFNLVGDYVVNAESQYSQLSATCPSESLLQTAVDDLTDFLLVQPYNQLALRIRTQLETRLTELKEAPVQ